MDCTVKVVRNYYLDLDDVEAKTLLLILDQYKKYIDDMPTGGEIIDGEGELLSELVYNLRRVG